MGMSRSVSDLLSSLIDIIGETAVALQFIEEKKLSPAGFELTTLRHPSTIRRLQNMNYRLISSVSFNQMSVNFPSPKMHQ